MRAPAFVVSLLVLLVPRVGVAQDAPPVEPPAPPVEPKSAPAELPSSALQPPVVEPKASNPKGPRVLGESCGASPDCAEGLGCVRNVCVEKGEQATPSSDALHAPALRGYVGGMFGVLDPMLWRGAFFGGFQGAFRAGLLYHGVQFQLELAPGSTMAANVDEPILGMFEGAITVGYLVPVGNVASWVLRVGGGGGGAFGESDPVNGEISAFGELRAEVFGVAIPTSKHLVVEIDVPSYRVLFLPGRNSLEIGMTWMTSFGFHYML